MNTNLILFPLLLLIIVGTFSQLYNNNIIDFSSENTQTQDLEGVQSVNGTDTTVSIGEFSLILDFNMTTGLVIIIAVATVLGLIGLNVLGSGLSDRSVKIIWNGIVYYGLWAIFSVFAIAGVLSIPYFGGFLWFLLTFIYTLGVFTGMGD